MLKAFDGQDLPKDKIGALIPWLTDQVALGDFIPLPGHSLLKSEMGTG